MCRYTKCFHRNIHKATHFDRSNVELNFVQKQISVHFLFTSEYEIYKINYFTRLSSHNGSSRNINAGWDWTVSDIVILASNQMIWSRSQDSWPRICCPTGFAVVSTIIVYYKDGWVGVNFLGINCWRYKLDLAPWWHILLSLEKFRHSF